MYTLPSITLPRIDKGGVSIYTIYDLILRGSVCMCCALASYRKGGAARIYIVYSQYV